MSLKAAYRKSLEGNPLSEGEIRYLIDLPYDRLPEMLILAKEIKEARFAGTVSLCAIINAKSGTCSEDCSFCAQSGHHSADSPTYPLIEPEKIAQAATKAAESGITRFGIVASGKLVAGKDLDGFARAVRLVAQTGIAPDLSPGVLDTAQLKVLKEQGLKGYHHNLETSASFFPSMCTTHAYDEDVAAVKSGLKAGLHVCSGGIFGIGESWDDRVELALLLRELGVHSVPMNFLHPIPGTPLEARPVLAPEEALKIVALYRFLLPDRALRICGGQHLVFADRKAELLASGASGLMVGDYLTTTGGSVQADLDDINHAGLTPATK